MRKGFMICRILITKRGGFFLNMAAKNVSINMLLYCYYISAYHNDIFWKGKNMKNLNIVA